MFLAEIQEPLTQSANMIGVVGVKKVHRNTFFLKAGPTTLGSEKSPKILASQIDRDQIFRIVKKLKV